MTADEPRPMTDAEADYLLAAGLGLAQGVRLIPVRDLAAHFERRFAEARARAVLAEQRALLHELAFADILRAFVGEAELLMDARRNRAIETLKSAGAMSEKAAAELPPSRRPLAEDEAWADVGPRPR